MPDFKDLLSGVRPEQLKVDASGRVVIDDRELADAIKGSVDLAVKASEELMGNGLCCGNGNCASPELVGFMERLVGKRQV